MSLAEERSQQVLVADDDEDDFFTFQVACEELSYKIMLSNVRNSEALFEALNKNMPDILFLDIMMPTMPGNLCLRELRSMKRYDSLPIIMYTSMADFENIEFCYREGANLYVIKPGTFTELKLALQKILTINWKTTMYFPPRAAFVITRTD